VQKRLERDGRSKNPSGSQTSIAAISGLNQEEGTGPQPARRHNTGPDPTRARIRRPTIVRSTGTYVPPYVVTNPNSTRRDNFSTSGNYNPNTGTTATRTPLRRRRGCR
jgi:hypothetical protein